MNTDAERGQSVNNHEAGHSASEIDADDGSTLKQQLSDLDKNIYTAIARSNTPALDEPLRRLSNAANYSRLWLGIATGLATLGGRRGRRAAVTGMAAIGVASAVANLGIKPIYHRRRPNRETADVPNQRLVRMPSSTSFPSGHSASAFAFATAVTSQIPVLGVPLITLAGAVAYSRVHCGVHYPGDVVVGSELGIFAGSVTATTVRYLERHRRSQGCG